MYGALHPRPKQENATPPHPAKQDTPQANDRVSLPPLPLCVGRLLVLGTLQVHPVHLGTLQPPGRGALRHGIQSSGIHDTQPGTGGAIDTTYTAVRPDGRATQGQWRRIEESNRWRLKQHRIGQGAGHRGDVKGGAEWTKEACVAMRIRPEARRSTPTGPTVHCCSRSRLLD